MTSNEPATNSQSRDDLLKHLEFIQTIIARQAANSFLLKGWSITLVAGLFALASKDANLRFAVIALLPTIGFCILDAYYVHQEKRFRRLYNFVRRGLTLEQQEQLGPFCLAPECVPEQEKRLLVDAWEALSSPAVGPFYLILLAATFALR